MARLNVEDSAFAAARQIAKWTGIDRRFIMGILCDLWHESQTLELAEVEQFDLDSWLELDKFGEAEKQNLISGFERYGILTATGINRWKIDGNARHIENIRTARENARTNGKKGGRPNGTKITNAGSDAGTGTANQSANRSTVQFSSVQGSSVQNKKANAHASHERVIFDFEKVYQSYPRKIGKQKGIERAKKEIKTEPEYDSLLEAVSRFSKYHSKAGTDPKYIPYFSTFMSSWRDWLDPQAGAERTLYSINTTPIDLEAL